MDRARAGGGGDAGPGRSRPVSYYAWSGHEHHANTTETARAMALLYALTGSFDQRGGNVLFPAVPDTGNHRRGAAGGAEHGACRGGEDTSARAGGVEQRLRAGFLPRGARWRTLSNTRARGNRLDLLLAFSDPLRGRRALAALDFYVHADLFMNPTAELADIVLPVASCFEREALRFGFEISAEAQSLVQFRQRVAPPPGAARSDTDIIFDLAVRLGSASISGTGMSRRPTATSSRRAGSAWRPCGPNRGAFACRSRPLRQARRAGHEWQCARLRHALAQGGVLVRDPAGEGLRADAGICAAPVSSGGSLPARAHLRQADAVLPDPAPRAAKSAPSRDGSGGHAASGDRGPARHRGWRLGKRRDTTGAMRARALLNANIDRRVVVGEHGWWQAAPEANAPGYDPFSPQGSNYNLTVDPSACDPISGTRASIGAARSPASRKGSGAKRQKSWFQDRLGSTQRVEVCEARRATVCIAGNLAKTPEQEAGEFEMTTGMTIPTS